MSQSATATSREVSLARENLTPENTVDVVRSRMYYLLSLAFSFPGKKLQSGKSDLWELAATLYPDLGFNKQETDVAADEMEAEYINVFDGHEQKMYCKPYEGLWMDADRAKRQWEVKKFYRFFGLGLNRKTNEMPDHVANELEFMHFLAYKAVTVGKEAEVGASADVNRTEHYLHAQKDFLERHLGQWLPAFCERVQQKAAQPFYHQLAILAARFVEDDREWLREQCENRPA